MLVEIAALEPVRADALPEATIICHSQLVGNVRRLVAQGLIRRMSRPGTKSPRWLTLNREHPHYREIRNVLVRIGALNGIDVPRNGKRRFRDFEYSPEWVTYELGAIVNGSKQGKAPFGNRHYPPIFTLFGTPHRTHAILMVGSTERLNGSSIARGVGIGTDQPMKALLDPIEDDGIFECELSGNLNLYRLRSDSWTPALRRLIKAIMDTDPLLQSNVAATKALAQIAMKRKKTRRPGYVRRAASTD